MIWLEFRARSRLAGRADTLSKRLSQWEGMTLDDLHSQVGQEIGLSAWHEISQPRIDDFAHVTGDDQWIHIDPMRARNESPYGSTVAHGFLTVSLLPLLIREAVDLRGKMSVNYGFNRLRFTAPVPPGSRVRARFTLNSMKDIDGGVEIAWGVVVEIEGREKPALVAEWLARTYS